MNAISKVLQKVFRPNGEKLTSNALRKLGFIGVTICSVSLNMNFFQSLGESWVMPVCGVILVFMEIWHWVSAQESYGIRKIFHYSAWLAICLTSILAVVSFGQTITAISSDAVAQTKVEITDTKNARKDMYEKAKASYDSAQDQIDTATTLLQATSPYDKGPQERLAKQIADARAAQATANALMEKYSGIEETPAVQQSAGISQDLVKKNISARLIFSKLFTEQHADQAIKYFFIVFGIAMELTLSLSAMPPQKRKFKNRRKLSTLIWNFLRIKMQKQLIALEKNLKKEEKMLDAPSTQQETKQKKTKTRTPVIKMPEPVIAESKSIIAEAESISEAEPTIEEVNLIPEEPQPDERLIETIQPEPAEVSKEVIESPEVEEPTEVVASINSLAAAASDIIEEAPPAEAYNRTEDMTDGEMKEFLDLVTDAMGIKPSEEQVVDEHKPETETAFLFKEAPVSTLSEEEKKVFVENTTKIFAELKKNNAGELSVKQMSHNIGLSVDEIKKMFKYFFNRNLLQYDETSKRWKFKLKQDSIINYLKDKEIQY